MTAKLINGKDLAASIRRQLAQRVQALVDRGHRPGLAVVLVGEDPASQVYVRNKIKACSDTGITSIEHRLPADTSQEALLELIARLNDDETVDGILVQLPVPDHINPERIIEAIDPLKDVDGFHPNNIGNLVIGREGFLPCTPYGVMKMIESTGYDLTGKHAVIVGRSNIVGKPQTLMLLAKNATVTVVHSRTRDLAAMTRQADVLVAAVGKAKLIGADMVKPGAMVLDVGINRDENGALCGDVDTEAVSRVAGWISPVPGGVGPMTIAMLLTNTVEAVERRLLK
ncbi:MAG: bifunctional methylenetetrahydrofolate dehydrogenase/methenyltetrahydrofolate cyclohydrolase FolD [Duodenibacillus sp.]|jgi:methylenetetrahydrofolate dehydrogenase (NADP+)/methenyltetrahydrofolate cyclohydrolase|nr:bifunctional methylenetetrahydrofolate dehydrogenase/methenyltetrahydrofolate cyclohydrolase FolD [Duodenibacillus sp.]